MDAAPTPPTPSPTGRNRPSQRACAVLAGACCLLVGVRVATDRLGTRPTVAVVPSERLDLNRATAGELRNVPGVGPGLAKAIADFRDSRGGFDSVDQLDEVPGVGPATLAKIAPHFVAAPRSVVPPAAAEAPSG